MSAKLSGVVESKLLELEKEGKVRDVGNQAVWSLSSFKHGFGVEQLCDASYDTYWQSDGPQPHLVNIQFRRKTLIHDVCVYADYKADESYTPNRISVRAGNNFNDLMEIVQVDLHEPQGWIQIVLDQKNKRIKTFMIQIAILSNHQNGRDTHVRRMKIRSPIIHAGLDCNFTTLPEFSSIECSSYAYRR